MSDPTLSISLSLSLTRVSLIDSLISTRLSLSVPVSHAQDTLLFLHRSVAAGLRPNLDKLHRCDTQINNPAQHDGNLLLLQLLRGLTRRPAALCLRGAHNPSDGEAQLGFGQLPQHGVAIRGPL